MQADKKIESFVVSIDEQFLYYGTISGQVVSMRVDDFGFRKEIQAHAGTIIAMAVHETLPFLVCLAIDRTVSLWRVDGLNLTPMGMASIRHLEAENDAIHYSDIVSNAQAVAFHPIERRIVTRTANGAIAEIDFLDDGTFKLLRCTRFYPAYDVITVRYSASPPYRLLSGAGNGEIVLSDEGVVLERWKVEDESVHWIEHLGGADYLIASDSRLLARLDISSGSPPFLGEKFARDDFEHVVVNQVDGRVYASSFDRNIYRLDPIACLPVGIVFRAPFKCRWLHSLKRQPRRLIVQVRDGSLFDVDTEDGSVLQKLRTTPLALWSCLSLSGREMRIYGEAQRSLTVSVNPPSTRETTIPSVSASEVNHAWLPLTGFVKRAQYCDSTKAEILAHSSGALFIKRGESINSVDLRSAIRDIHLHASGTLYAATELGVAFAVSVASGKIISEYVSPNGFPYWAIAVNPSGSLVAVFERHGVIVLLDADSLACVVTIPSAGRCKRAKWLDDRFLFFTHAGEIRVLDALTLSIAVRVPYAGNTVEDFLWDRKLNYLVAIGYTNKIGLYDFSSGVKLDETHDQIDYSKGLSWLSSSENNTSYPFDLISYGRSGGAHLFRIHNECLISLGAVTLGGVATCSA
ncbi:hypothetical protein [Pseudomonas hunanensis]|uniref:hypothetical protein n=1 Tax=Pseudomonas hunanensis TaxID=1247546 RepID=UPI002405A7D8|nr:hypothetical protein [Pseudomonas hunanensis]MDF9756056.1 hypothetical protein [Pseudomonas hunanensis]